ncbi:RNA-binding protein 25-like isoform X2 [Mercenaria mercenaria]|uniref:RNA-binding protein 25-like isoform X1 n=1 Tax=Mercenaria mercenaria TaxID=6596 RepID=UPI00234E93D1|nr:RNA-binding protein 25-like isoform X1 [Mercenaria mercenaria]XP_053376206.1 RNA-binding protein 25-like isoform X2 [Mercenaria mercenaria]
MSFPPRPPVGMPPMTGMMSTGYTFTPMGMMPMGMGMMPPTTMIRPVVTNATATVVTRPKKQLVPQEIDKDDKKEEKPPVTTVFVGNISERAPDSMVRTMLQRCGNVISWKRVQGASGKLQAFGFCEYEDPEATLRCMRLLNEWEIADKKLVVKVDAKTKTLLDDWKSKKKSEESKEDKEKNGDKDDKTEEGEMKDDKDTLDEFTLREDRVAKAGLDAIMREYAFELAKEPATAKTVHEPVSEIPKVPMPPIKQKDASQLRDTGLDDLNMEADTKDLINREIQSFRNLHKDIEDVEAEKEREREREREKERRMAEERRRKEKERELQRLKELEMYEERRKATKRRESRSRSRSRSSSRGRSSRRSRSRERERERERDRRARDRELEEEEEAYERRKMEKKIREKEIAYQERLKNWEARERKKAREYEKEREREDERKAEELREARRLREFLEDYDDERDDPKFYKGSALERRLRERQKEKEVDSRDRAKEKEELEEIRRKLLEEGHPDLEGEMAKIEREREEHLRPMLQINDNIAPHSPSESSSEDEHPASPPREPSEEESQEKFTALPNMKPTLQPVDESSRSAGEASADDEASRMSIGYSEDSQQPVYGPNAREDSRLGFGAMKFSANASGPNSPTEQTSGKRKKLTVGDVFNQDDDDSLDGAKKRKLVPLDYGDSGDDSASGLEGKKATSAEEKRAKIKTLIENIPTAKDELFAFQLDWRIVDQSLMDKRIKPWVNKKIIEYIGEEEPTLTDFICQKVMAQSPPQNILNDVAMVLDEEAEVFVVKMWRLLVYETEAKKAGLVK